MYDREYEYIMAIAQTGTLSRAAVSLGISQPALTRFLQKEEQTINTKLFQKTSGRLTLTYAGECYINYIKKILSIQKGYDEQSAGNFPCGEGPHPDRRSFDPPTLYHFLRNSRIYQGSPLHRHHAPREPKQYAGADAGGSGTGRYCREYIPQKGQSAVPQGCR